MQVERGGLDHVAEALANRSGPVKAIRDSSPQARHSFTQADQVNLLVNASEADPDRVFMARTMGALLPAPQQPRKPAPVQARQRPFPPRIILPLSS